MNDDFFAQYAFDSARLIQEVNRLEPEVLLKTEITEYAKKGFNYLHAAAYYGLDDVLLAILKKTGGRGLNTPDRKGRTPIHHLASNGHTIVLQEILEQPHYAEHINLEQINYKGRTALHSTAKHLHRTMVELLISKGAYPNALDVQGNTPLSLVYHRYYPGDGIDFSQSANEIIDFLLTRTHYWEQMLAKYSLTCEDKKEQSRLLAWCLGMKHAMDLHWIPGMLLPINARESYRIEQVDTIDLSQFVVLKEEQSDYRILLCLDRTPALQKMVCLTKHMASHYLHTLNTRILPLLKRVSVSKIWGIELAGIDAQWLALHLPLSRLILINSPGIGKNYENLHRLFFTASIMDAPTVCDYFFDVDDVLHSWGQYLWIDPMSSGFYTRFPDVTVIDPATQTTSSMLGWALKGLEKQKNIHEMPIMRKLEDYVYAEGCSDWGTEEALPEISDNQEEIKTLFDNTTLAISAIEESIADNPEKRTALINFARYEYCAHGLAYLHLPHGQKLERWWGEDYRLSFIHGNMHRVVHHQGLYCYLLQHGQEWVLQFQGTDFSDFSSASRDLDRASAGIKRIRQQYNQIIEVLAHKLREIPASASSTFDFRVN